MANAVAILKQVKQALRDKYAWPGGYPLFIVMADGEALCIDAAKEHWCLIVRSTLQRARDGWCAAGAQVNWEDTELFCAHSNVRIESAYGERN